MGLGLIPADSALPIVGPWFRLRNDASLVPIPVMALAHDSAGLLATAFTFDSVMPKQPASQRGPLTYFSASARAYAALARNDTAEAIRLFDALPDSIVTVPLDRFVHARLLEGRDPRRALALLELKGQNDVLVPARALERARIAERLGDRQAAVRLYARVADLWRNTDSPPLQAARDEARTALQRLDADGRMRAELTRS